MTASTDVLQNPGIEANPMPPYTAFVELRTASFETTIETTGLSASDMIARPPWHRTAAVYCAAGSLGRRVAAVRGEAVAA